MDKILLGDLCLPASKNIKLASTDLIDYVDISSVDNQAKFITGYTTYEYQDAPSRARKSVSIGDVIISTVRPNLNAVAVFDITTPNTPVVSTGFCVLSCRDDVNPRYVYYACQSREFIRQLVSQATGASYPAVNDKIIRNALIPNYTLSSQNFICDQLDSVQNLINIKKKENKIFNETIKARFVEMFGDPEINPKGWDKAPLKDHAEVLVGYPFPSEGYSEEGVDIVGGYNLMQGYIQWNDSKHWLSRGELTAEVLANYLRHEHLPDCTLLSENARCQLNDGTLSEAGNFIRQDHNESQAA